ncbi:MAG: MlaD family protein, partial [Acidimicrobiales bacterium]
MRRPAVLAGVLAAGLAVGASGCNLSLESLPQLGGQSGSGYKLHAVFDNVQNLAPEAQVRDGDSIVGNVTSISTSNYHADLTLRINKDVSLPAGTTAEVRFNTPLGDEYVELGQPTGHPAGPALKPGATIGPPDTKAAPSVEDLLAAV